MAAKPWRAAVGPLSLECMAVVALGALWGAGCGGASYSPATPDAVYREQTASYTEVTTVTDAESGEGGGRYTEYGFDDARVAGDLDQPAMPPGTVLATTPTEPATPAAPDEPRPEGSEPILIYTATLYMGVYQVAESQQQVIALAAELDGFLFSQDDATVVIRVPAAHFQEALDRLEGLGDVLHRNIQVQDISEEFNDLTIRLETLNAMRARLEELLPHATTVADTLAIERELQRITVDIETLEGRLRFLRDRVAFSTITVTFQSNVPAVQAQAPVQLPFPWISQLGLTNLLYLW